MSEQTPKSPKTPVTRRHVFYIPGYDPIHPRRYRELYRKESAAQGAISGYETQLSPKQGGGRYGWNVRGEIDDASVEAQFEVLVWSDIVKGSMDGTIPQTYWLLARTAWTYIATGTLRRLMWLRKGPIIAALYPVGMLIVQFLLAWLAGHLAGRLAQFALGLIPASGTFATLLSTLSTLAYWGALLAVAIALLRWFKKQDGKFFAYYLMHDYAYSASSKGANPAPLEARMAEFRLAIAQALRSDVDEVLIVGHSSGAHLGVSILADLLRKGERPQNGPALSFLSLGQVVPMVSFLPKADRLRSDLAFLCTREDITWVDITAPGDGCAFALCDPVAVSGVGPEDKTWPLVVSAAFTQTLSPERWAELRWRFFRLHFQYLCAFDRPGDYDYFQITAGPLTLGERYKGRKPSMSRIDIAASKYTSVDYDHSL